MRTALQVIGLTIEDLNVSTKDFVLKHFPTATVKDDATQTYPHQDGTIKPMKVFSWDKKPHRYGTTEEWLWEQACKDVVGMIARNERS